MKRSKFKLIAAAQILLCLLIVSTDDLQAQGREFIRQKIREHGECRNVTITKRNGDLVFYGSNGWAATGCPSSLTNALNELNDDDEYLSDVQLTEEGRWIILYGNNGFRWNDIPYSLERKLRQYNDDNELVLSVTFNDANDWIVITEKHFAASDDDISDWLKEGNETYGMLWSACVTDDAVVAVFAEGYKYAGNVPEDLKEALKKTTLDVFRIKIAGSAWFFADINGSYNYNM